MFKNLAFLILWLLSSFYIIAEEIFNDTTYLNKEYNIILSIIRSNKIYDHPQWHKLVHYEKNIFGNTISKATKSSFFVSPKGKYNPQLELEATIYSFLFGFNSSYIKTDIPQCKYPARWRWVKQILIQYGYRSAYTFNDTECNNFDKWKNEIHPDKLSIVFASSDLGDPASMFGHIFLLLKDNQKDLLGYSLGFSARIPNITTIEYLFKGVFGSFDGYYDLIPYDAKIKEYSHLESRNLWELELNLTQNEILLFLEHIWELRAISFDYYFFDANCSYYALRALSVISNKFNIIDSFIYPIQPLDTIRKLNENQLIKKYEYRPSLENSYQARYNQLSFKEKKILNSYFSKIYKNNFDYDNNINFIEKLNQERSALLLDTIIYKLRYEQKKIKENDYIKLFDYFTTQRSNIKIASPSIKENFKNEKSPSFSQGTSSISIFGLYQNQGQNLIFNNSTQYNIEINLIPTFKKILDASIGYPPYFQFIFLSPSIRYIIYPLPQIQLNKFILFDIINLPPIFNSIYKPSWNLSSGFIIPENNRIENYKITNNLFYTQAGIGTSFLLGHHFVLFYIMANVRLEAGYYLNSKYRIASFPELGLLIRIASVSTLLLTAEYRFFFLGELKELPILRLGYNIRLLQNFALELNMLTYLERHNWLNWTLQYQEWKLGSIIYF